MSEADDKVLENRLRRMLQRRGYQLIKSRRRDPRAIDYGGYMIADASTNGVVAGGSPNRLFDEPGRRPPLGGGLTDGR